MPHSGLPNEDELASEGDGRGRPVGDRASSHEGLQEGGGGREQGRGAGRGPRTALWQANRKPGGLYAEKAAAGIPGAGGGHSRCGCVTKGTGVQHEPLSQKRGWARPGSSRASSATAVSGP